MDEERLTKDERTLLEARKKAALPWVIEDPNIFKEPDSFDWVGSVQSSNVSNWHDNLVYIVAAANAVPGLLAEISRLRGEVADATRNMTTCAEGGCLGCIDFLGWTRPETTAEEALHTPTANELRGRIKRAEAERDALRDGLATAFLLDKRGSSVLDAMLTWPTGSFGPIAIAAYESLVRRLAPLAALLSSSPASPEEGSNV